MGNAGTSPQFHDHFSERAPGYAVYRPVYPRTVVDCLANLAFGNSSTQGPQARSSAPQGIVWEAGCGSGQLTLILAERFRAIIATDASADQIARAPRREGIEYRVARSEESGLDDSSVDLAVAAQAAHWFDLDGYYREVRRVVRPGGLIAFIVYGLHSVGDPIIDRIMKQFYGQTLEGYWPPQRRWVEEEYQNLAFPFSELSVPRFEMTAEWNLDEMLGYVETWSAVGVMIKAKGRGLMDAFRLEMERSWGTPLQERIIRWPLVLRVGRI